MKNIVALFLLWFCGIEVSTAQRSAPSTVRQVFSFQKGDSMEYAIYFDRESWMTVSIVCNTYLLKVVDSVYFNPTNDTSVILFRNYVIHRDSTPTLFWYGPCPDRFSLEDYFALSMDKWLVPNLDSSIVYLIDTIYHSLYQGLYHAPNDSIHDTVTLTNGVRNNYFRFKDSIWGETYTNYLDSLGVTSKYEQLTSIPWGSSSEDMIYYHKVNGRRSGNFISDIAVVTAAAAHTIIYPNPTNSIIHISSDLHDAGVELRDLLGQILYVSKINGEAVVNLTGLKDGIYLLSILSADGESITRKIVKE